MQQRQAIGLLRSRTVRGTILLAAAGLLCLPVLVAGGVAGVLGEERAAACSDEAGEAVSEPAAGGTVAAGMFAAPLKLEAGRWYEVGATRYGGPGDPTSGHYGAIPDPSQNYLPEHPDSFAELSVLNTNPASSGSFSFADANALNELPYLTNLRVRHEGRELVLAKRDVGYGQGPVQSIGNGEPYRLDVWWKAAEKLGVSKSAVNIRLAPQTGAAGALEALPESREADTGAMSAAGEACEAGVGEGPLPLTAGTRTKILPDGLAAAGREAPRAVKEMVAAGNRLYGTSYLYGGGHGVPLSQLQSAYDCSSSVSYLLYSAGLWSGEYAEDSTDLESYGKPGPGRYVSIYANAQHAFIFVGGLRLDTVDAPEYDSGPNSGREGARWRVYPGVPDWSTWTVRHPAGL